MHLRYLVDAHVLIHVHKPLQTHVYIYTLLRFIDNREGFGIVCVLCRYRCIYRLSVSRVWHVDLKLQVSFAKEPYKRDYILQKRPVL